MSQEYYVVCDECKKKVHLGCVGMSGFQCWTADREVMDEFAELLKECMFHFGKVKFVWEGSTEDQEYEDVRCEGKP